MKLLLMLSAVAAIGLASPEAVAQVWNEQADAGELPGTAQITVGTGPLTAINGSCTAGTDVDLYSIHIDGSSYSASVCNASTNFDTQLWLFRPNGTGVAFRDDDDVDCALNGLQSTLGVTQPGIGDYLIGISRFDRDAANSSGTAIWLDMPYETERTPDGPAAADPVAQWIGAAVAAGAYQIVLTGVSYRQAVPVEPTTWGRIKATYRD